MTLGWIWWRAWALLVACGGTLRGRRGTWRHPHFMCLSDLCKLCLSMRYLPATRSVPAMCKQVVHVLQKNFVHAILACLTATSCKPCLALCYVPAAGKGKGDVLRLRQVGGLVTKRHAQLHFGRIGIETAVTCFLIFLVLFQSSTV